MSSKALLAIVRSFALEFTRTGLYDTGFGDSMIGSGATTADTPIAMMRALAYVKGQADMAQTLSRYQSPHWWRARIVGCFAGITITRIDSGESDAADQTARSIQTWRAELLHECERERRDPNPVQCMCDPCIARAVERRHDARAAG